MTFTGKPTPHSSQGGGTRSDLNSFNDFYRKANERIWPWLPSLCYIRSIVGGGHLGEVGEINVPVSADVCLDEYLPRKEGKMLLNLSRLTLTLKHPARARNDGRPNVSFRVTCHFAWHSATVAEKACSHLPGFQRHERSTQDKPHPGKHSTITRFGNGSTEKYRTLVSYWEGCRKSRRCLRDTYPESHITKNTSIRR